MGRKPRDVAGDRAEGEEARSIHNRERVGAALSGPSASVFQQGQRGKERERKAGGGEPERMGRSRGRSG